MTRFLHAAAAEAFIYATASSRVCLTCLRFDDVHRALGQALGVARGERVGCRKVVSYLGAHTEITGLMHNLTERLFITH
jgi:hypothetical protein